MRWGMVNATPSQQWCAPAKHCRESAYWQRRGNMLVMMMMYWEGCFKGRTQIYYPIPKGGNVTIECLPRVIQHAKGGDCGGWGGGGGIMWFFVSDMCMGCGGKTGNVAGEMSLRCIMSQVSSRQSALIIHRMRRENVTYTRDHVSKVTPVPSAPPVV